MPAIPTVARIANATACIRCLLLKDASCEGEACQLQADLDKVAAAEDECVGLKNRLAQLPLDAWTNELVCLLILPVALQTKTRNDWWQGQLVDCYLLAHSAQPRPQQPAPARAALLSSLQGIAKRGKAICFRNKAAWKAHPWAQPSSIGRFQKSTSAAAHTAVPAALPAGGGVADTVAADHQRDQAFVDAQQLAVRAEAVVDEEAAEALRQLAVRVETVVDEEAAEALRQLAVRAEAVVDEEAAEALRQEIAVFLGQVSSSMGTHLSALQAMVKKTTTSLYARRQLARSAAALLKGQRRSADVVLSVQAACNGL